MELSDLVIKVRPSVVRVLIEHSGNVVSVGTGFFLKKDLVVTCAHVLLGVGPLKQFGENLQRLNPTKSIPQLFKEHFQNQAPVVKIELFDGTIIQGTNANFDYLSDVAWVSVPPSDDYELLEVGNSTELVLGKYVAFCGFPDTPYIETVKWPFSVNAGFVSTVANTYVTAYEKMDYIQINAVNLNGNSGGPLLSQDTGMLIGLINGNMNHGSDNVAFLIPQGGVHQLQAASFRIPLPVAYATPIDLVISKLPIS